MFCDKCGSAIQPDQRFCGKCGKEFGGGAGVGAPRPNRVKEHIRLLGILWLALSALNAVGGMVLFIVANTILRHHWPGMGPEGGPQMFLHPFLSLIAVLILIKAAAGFAAGWGLLQREPWARVVTLIVAFLALFNIP